NRACPISTPRRARTRAGSSAAFRSRPATPARGSRTHPPWHSAYSSLGKDRAPSSARQAQSRWPRGEGAASDGSARTGRGPAPSPGRGRRRAEHEATLLDAVGGALDAAELPKAALVQHADGRHVARGDLRVERARRLFLQELGERRRSHTPPPVLTTDPVPDAAPPLGAPAADVSRHATVDHDGAHPGGGIAEHSRAPVRQ